MSCWVSMATMFDRETESESYYDTASQDFKKCLLNNQGMFEIRLLCHSFLHWLVSLERNLWIVKSIKNVCRYPKILTLQFWTQSLWAKFIAIKKREVGSVDSKVRGIVCMFAFCKQSLQNVTDEGTTSMTWVYLLNGRYDVGDSKKITIKRNIVTKSVSELWFRMIGWRFRLQVQTALKYRPWGSARLSVGCCVEIVRWCQSLKDT